eukprot:jgi/Chlat1/2354/Chrsp17S02807
MSGYENIVKGKLKLKAKALSEQGEPGKARKKKRREPLQSPTGDNPASASGHNQLAGEVPEPIKDSRTAAEKRYDEQMARIEAQRVTKLAAKTHRQKVDEFNKYLSNLSEHYDIPKVGPG